MGDTVSGCSCELFSPDVSSKTRNKYTTTDTESDIDNGDSDTDDNQYTNNQKSTFGDYKSIKTCLQTTTTKTHFIKHVQEQTEQQILIPNKPKKTKKNKDKCKTKTTNTPISPKKSKKKRKKKKDKKRKKLNKLKLNRSQSYNLKRSKSRPILIKHKTDILPNYNNKIPNDLILSPGFIFMSEEFEALIKAADNGFSCADITTHPTTETANITNYSESKQTDIPSSPPHKAVTFIDTYSNSNTDTPKLKLINETSSDNHDLDNGSLHGTVIYHTNDNESVKSQSFDNISIKSFNTMPANNNFIPTTNLTLGRSKSAGPPELHNNNEELHNNNEELHNALGFDRRYSLSPSINYTTPNMTAYVSDSLPSFTKSYSISNLHSNASIISPYSNRSSMVSVNNNNLNVSVPPLKTLHSNSHSMDMIGTYDIMQDNTGVNLSKRRQSKPTKVLTKENSNDWSVDRLVTENDAMKKQLLFLKRYNSERHSRKLNTSNTYWIEKNECI